MSKEEILTKGIAEKFIEDEDSVDLDEFTEIDDEAAEMLADFWEEDGGVEPETLNGLETLSDAAALSYEMVCWNTKEETRGFPSR